MALSPTIRNVFRALAGIGWVIGSLCIWEALWWSVGALPKPCVF